MHVATKLSDWVLAPRHATPDRAVATHHADAIPIEEWLEEMAQSMSEGELPGSILKAMVADGFGADEARFLLLAAFARYSSLPLIELSTAQAVKCLLDADPGQGTAPP